MGAGVVDTPVAAAASTLIYQLAYDDDSGYDDNDKEEEGKEEEGKEEVLSSTSESKFSIPEGLVFLDDNDVILIGPNSDDELFSSYPKNKSCNKNFVPGGPQPPDLSNYPKGAREEVWLAYKKKRKAYNNKE